MKTLFFTTFFLLNCFIAALAHYGDPYDPPGCVAGEREITIGGIAGAMCAPNCQGKPCPTDVPPLVTATPECVIQGPYATAPNWCALVCDPTATANACGHNATCKAVPPSAAGLRDRLSSGNGICTYDDLPGTAHWQPMESPSFAQMSVAWDVGFASPLVGWVGGAKNGVGPVIQKTVDGGKTWDVVWTKPVLDIFLAAAVKSATQVVIGGVLFQTYSEDGTTFHAANNAAMSSAQDAHVLPDGRFALVGAFGVTFSHGPANGLALSPDGKHYTYMDTGVSTILLGLARYGSFPSKDVWYISFGIFPQNNGDGPGPPGHRLNKHATIKADGAPAFHYEYDTKYDAGAGGDPGFPTPAPIPVPCNVNPENCFAAAIAKTENAGKTWQVVWKDQTSNIYANGIHCSSETHCVAVTEGDFASIRVTRDGGKTWKESQHDPDPASQLMMVHMMSEDEVWVTGPSTFRSTLFSDRRAGASFPLSALRFLDRRAPEPHRIRRPLVAQPRRRRHVDQGGRARAQHHLDGHARRRQDRLLRGDDGGRRRGAHPLQGTGRCDQEQPHVRPPHRLNDTCCCLSECRATQNLHVKNTIRYKQMN